MSEAKFKLAVLVPVLLTALLVTSCDSDYDVLVKQMKQTSPEQWHNWAKQVLEHSKTNASGMPRSEWPEFARRISADESGNWELVVLGGDFQERFVSLIRMGGFQSFGVDFGSASFVETNSIQARYKVIKIHAGVYVRRTF